MAAVSSRCNLICIFVSFSVRFPFTFALRTRIIENTGWMRLKAIGFLRGHMTKPMIYTLTDADAGCPRMDPPARTIFDSGLRKVEYA
jgi:hypothetical protein